MANCITFHGHNDASQKGHWGGRTMFGVLTVVHVVLSSAVAQSIVDPPQAPDGQINGNGIVESASVVHVAAPFKSLLLEVRADGESVRKGEVVAELDTAELQDQMQIQEINVAIAKQFAEQVKNTLNRLKKQRALQEQHRALSEKTVELEKDFLTAGNGGFATRLKQLQVKQRANDLTLDYEKRRHAQRLAQGKTDPGTNDAIAESNVAVARAEANVESVALELQLLKKSQPLKLYRLEVASSRNKLNIMADINDLQERIENLERDLKRHEANAGRESYKLKRIKKNIQSAKLVAPSDGVVRRHLATRHGDRYWVEQGDPVKERQSILEIRDEEHLQVQVRVAESTVSAIRKGQHVKMLHLSKTDSSVYHGRVQDIARLPTRDLTGARSYEVVVTLPNPRTLKIGEHLVAEFQTE